MTLLADMAANAGFRWVAIKAADGVNNFNQGSPPSWGGPNLLLEAINRLRIVGIHIWLWQYIYGADWLGRSTAVTEAQKAIENINRFNPDGWIIDPEKEYKRNGAAAWADTYMNMVRASCPSIPIGLSSYRFPTLHPELPWHNFLRHSNFHAPQVYWLLAHNSGAQLFRSVSELKALANLPIVPIGAAYYDTGYKWQPTVAEINEFDRTAHELNLPGITWWEWGENGHGAQYISEIWAAISAHDWGDPVIPPQDWAHAMTSWAKSMGYVGPEPG